MLALVLSYSEALVVPAPLAISPARVLRAPQPAAVFGMFKESEESKARKEAEFKAQQDLQRLRQDPEAYAKYQEEIQARRLEETRKRWEEEAKTEEAVVVSKQLPPGWSAAKDADGDTYYWNVDTKETQWDFPTA